MSKKKKSFILTTLIQHSIESPSQHNRLEKKSYTDLKRIKSSLFMDDMIVYIDNLKNLPKKPRINEFSKKIKYKIKSKVTN